MKIQRYGYKKYNGQTKILDAPIKIGNYGRVKHPRPKEGISWSQENKVLEFTLKGVTAKYVGQSDYGYLMQLSGDEIALIVERALETASDNQAIKAQGKAMAAYLREVLSQQT